MKRLSYEEIRNLCLGLSSLIHAGIGIGDGLAMLAEDEERKEYKEFLLQLVEKADCGFSMSTAFKESGAFPTYVCSLLEVGEYSGKIEETLGSLAEYYDTRMRIERQIKSALMYPALLLLIMLVVIVVLLTKVLPIFDAVYGQLGRELTGIAGSLLAAGQVLSKIMPLLCVVLFVAVLVIGLFACSDSFRRKAIGLWNEKRGHKGVAGKLNRAQIMQVMQLGMESGLAVEESLNFASMMMSDSQVLQGKCNECAELVRQGKKLGESLHETGILNGSESRLLDAGLKAGNGDSMMREIAERMDEESEDALCDAVTRVEPTLVMVTSLLVGLILLSVMLPLAEIMSAIG